VNAPNLLRCEARREQVGLPPGITIRDLLRTTLRTRPDGILVGEVRGGDANAAEQASRRFTRCVRQSGVDLPYSAIPSWARSASRRYASGAMSRSLWGAGAVNVMSAASQRQFFSTRHPPIGFSRDNQGLYVNHW